MGVKRSQSAARVLQVLEMIAHQQPIGVSELAKRLGTDKSATQRDVMTLSDGGWIRPAAGTPTRWELTGRLQELAQLAHGSSDLRKRARAGLEALQRNCGETVLLAAPEAQQFVVIDMVETTHFLRVSARVGLVIPAVGSATGRAILPYMTEEEQRAMVGIAPDARMRKAFRQALENGYAVSVGEVYAGSTNIAAPVFDGSGRPEAAIIVSAPSDRLARKYHAAVGTMVLETARALSRALPKAAADGSPAGGAPATKANAVRKAAAAR